LGRIRGDKTRIETVKKKKIGQDATTSELSGALKREKLRHEKKGFRKNIRGGKTVARTLSRNDTKKSEKKIAGGRGEKRRGEKT